jgi:AraC family transcriptional regulator of adaptative response / DNA-3-methyladenine glycosylase II
MKTRQLIPQSKPHQLSKTFANVRKARDARFDGVFFIAVKTTGIYCRPICPANSPLEKNVDYYDSAILAAQAGFRPCLRCRPDSAPQSCAWIGTDTTFQRAIDLIHQGSLQNGSIEQLADRLGISDRYLRDLFQKKLGTSPKRYATYQQCLFAKQLLHESDLLITDIAFASGFASVRRFNEAMKDLLGLAPRDIRKSDSIISSGLSLKVYYRPPYAWQNLFGFLNSRVIEGLEWADDLSYSRTIEFGGSRGYFTITPKPGKNFFELSVHLNDYRQLNPITQKVRSLFDVDAPIDRIDQQLQALLDGAIDYQPGLRVPGIWSEFEAGVRAVLGQQISIGAAKKLVTDFVRELGEPIGFANTPAQFLFPKPERVVNHSLDFFKMPQSRKDTLRRLAVHFLESSNPADIDAWIDIKGIGPWTINYVKMRAGKAPDIWLAGDAGLKNALKTLQRAPDIESMRPWRSYLTLQLWNQL